MRRFEVCSPKDGYVVEVVVANGQSVQKGDALLQMDTLEEDKNIHRFNHLSAVHSVARKKYSGPQFDKSVAATKASLVRAQEVLDEKKGEVEAIKKKIAIGAAYPADLSKLEVEVIALQEELAKAQMALESLVFSASNYLETAALISSHIDLERTAQISLKERMRILAPVAGTVSLQVAATSFLKLGHVLLTIES